MPNCKFLDIFSAMRVTAAPLIGKSVGVHLAIIFKRDT
jgi:hypothetical protein